MITLTEAKKNMLLKIKTLEETITFIKENTFYEKFCDNCHNIMKVKILKQGTVKTYCSDRCRGIAWRKKNNV